MFFIRLLLYGIIFYLAYKILRALLHGRSAPHSEVRGKSESKPTLDLRNQDVEDIDFKEIKE
ncbi:MAG TPA: hypothetical protein VGA99_03645 [bacterium]